MPNATVAPTVQYIAPTKTLYSKPLDELSRKKRVCAYARVSTDEIEQLSSYENQINYYEQYIKNREDYAFVKIYCDYGISGTSANGRDGFNQMIEDAMNDKFDLIITKSISRFSRNTALTLNTVAKLAEKGVEVYFEKEGIYTLDPKNSILFTLFSSLAQEESWSISENIRIVLENNRRKGKVTMPYSHFLGYSKGPDDKPMVDEDEAETVKLIYNLFLEGNTYANIARHLEKLHIESPSHLSKWSPSTVKSILTNEKYKGDALLGKTFTRDFLDKKPKINRGEAPQYYATNSHPGIIDKATFDQVQNLISEKQHAGSRSTDHAIFCGKIICKDCGNAFGHKVWRSRDINAYHVWVCNHKSSTKSKTKDRCKTPNLREEVIKDAYLSAIAQITPAEAEIWRNKATAKAQRAIDGNDKHYAAKLQKLAEEVETNRAALEAFCKKDVSSFSSPEDYTNQLFELNQAEQDSIKAYNDLQQKQKTDDYKANEQIRFADAIYKQQKSPSTFYNDVFTNTVDKILVTKDCLEFCFLDQSKVKVNINS